MRLLPFNPLAASLKLGNKSEKFSFDNSTLLKVNIYQLIIYFNFPKINTYE